MVTSGVCVCVRAHMYVQVSSLFSNGSVVLFVSWLKFWLRKMLASLSESIAKHA